MKRWAQLAVLLLLIGAHAAAGEVVDRIVARVGHRVVLQSELEDSMRYQALISRRSPGPFGVEERKQALEQLVDQCLIESQIDRSTFQRSSQANIERQVADIRQQLGVKDDSTWQALLTRYGLTPQDFEERLAWQVDILRFVDSRFRPNIHIDRRSVETYYREQFLPQLRKTSAREVPLNEVSGKIEEILVQQRIDDLMSVWLRNLRTQEEVQVP